MLKIRNATLQDLEEIMATEKASFIDAIQEQESVFKERLTTFPEGFLVFTSPDGEVAGYLCTEIWNGADFEDLAGSRNPEMDLQKNPEKKELLQKKFVVGHNIKDCHTPEGDLLYISSFALKPAFRGQGNGSFCFSISMEYLEAKLNVNKKILVVNEKWKGAQKIYSDCGFKRLFTIPSFFPAGKGKPGKEGIVMFC